MAEVKWVKLTTDMFDNRKVKHLRKLPEGNNIVLIWVMLLTMAGRCNSGGMIFLTENIPYTPKMLADELDFEENTVILALQALENLDMIVTENGFFAIAGWEEYQNTERLAEIREYNRLAQQKSRAKKKLLQGVNDNVNDKSMTSQRCHDTDIEEEKDKESDKEKRKKNKKEIHHKYGEYENVLLSDPDLEKLKAEFPTDWEARIERLSEYIASKGAKYKNHLATIRSWARKEKKSENTDHSFETNEFYEAALKKSYGG
jgi:predicted phage replisome organizer